MFMKMDITIYNYSQEFGAIGHINHDTIYHQFFPSLNPSVSFSENNEMCFLDIEG